MLRVAIVSIGFLIFLLSFGCKNDKVSEVDEMVIVNSQFQMDTCYNPASLQKLLSIDFVANAAGVEASAVRYVPNVRDDFRVKGFYLWDVEGDYSGNQGVFVSFIRNAYREHSDTYVQDMVETLRVNGETSAEGVKYLYEDWIDIGDDAVYSNETNTYVWQLQNCMLIKLAFNLQDDEVSVNKLAKSLAIRLTDSYFDEMSTTLK